MEKIKQSLTELSVCMYACMFVCMYVSDFVGYWGVYASKKLCSEKPLVAYEKYLKDDFTSQ